MGSAFFLPKVQRALCQTEFVTHQNQHLFSLFQKGRSCTRGNTEHQNVENRSCLSMCSEEGNKKVDSEMWKEFAGKNVHQGNSVLHGGAREI